MLALPRLVTRICPLSATAPAAPGKPGSVAMCLPASWSITSMLSRAVSAILFGVAPRDPLTYAGTSAAVLGFPRNGPYDERAGRLGATREVVTQDAYGRGPVRRVITSLRGAVRSGNSGGPMVDGRGKVVATIFAATTSGPRGGYGVPNSVVSSALGDARGRVSTGPCA